MNLHGAQQLAQTIGSLPGLGSAPIVRMAARYWVVSIPTSIALFGILRERYKNNGKMYEYFIDASKVLGPVMSMVAIFELANKMEQQGKLTPPVPPAQPALPQG